MTEWCNPFLDYDRVYMSKVFTFTEDFETYLYSAKEVIRGGTGYGLDNKLPQQIETMYPDYSLYRIKNTAYGYMTRGCPRQCPFCIVGEKEGCKTYKVADLEQFWRGQKEIKLLDPNLLASPDKVDLLQQLVESKAWVDFTQGLDIRLMTDETTDLISRVKLKIVHFAWDREKESEKILNNLRNFKEATGIDRRKAAVYVLTNYETDFEFDLFRVYKLKELGYDPYIMIYNKGEFVNENTNRMFPMALLLKKFTRSQIDHFKKCWKLQGWTNNKTIFQSCEKFENYSR